jgi:hypothetical protein
MSGTALAIRPAPGPRQVTVEDLTTEVGWLMVAAGVVGLAMPGVPGTPFLIVGAMVVTPGGKRRLSRWIGKNPPKFVQGAMGQLGVFLDDLERRYPRG